MPLIVDPSAPHVTPPVVVASPDGWLRATVDTLWAGVILAVDYTAGDAPLDGAAGLLHARITRQDPGAAAPVAVRSADPLWAVGGSGAAYDHEAPLGVAVVYTAVPVFADGSAGPASSVAVTVPAPEAPADVWIKSVDEPSVSARVTVTSWPTLAWADRIYTADIAGSRYPITAQDVYASSSSSIEIDAEGDQIEVLETLLSTPGVRLIQTRPEYHRPDQYVLLSNPQQSVISVPTAPRTYTADLVEVSRPDTAGQPMRMPGWSFDALAARYGSYDAADASYSSYTSMSVDGRL